MPHTSRRRPSPRAVTCAALLGLTGALALPALTAPAGATTTGETAGGSGARPAVPSTAAQPLPGGLHTLTAGAPGLRSAPGKPLTGQRTDGTHALLRTAATSARARAQAAAAATYTVTYGSASTTKSTWQVTYGAGFTSGSDAQLAFGRAVSTWAGIVSSTVPITVDAQLTAFSDKNQLGGAGPDSFFGASGTPFYPVALANAITGSDLDTSADDIDADFSSNSVYYYGSTPGGITSATCSDAPEGCYDFQSVVLHELGHGLGFFGTGDVAKSGSTTVGTYGLDGKGGEPLVYDTYVEDNNHVPFLSNAPLSAAALDALQSARLFWAGPYASAADRGREPRLYAPTSFEEGSSYSHLSEASYPTTAGALNGDPDSLMTPAINPKEAERSPGQIAIGVLEDIGWQGTVLPGSSFTPITPTRILDTGSTKVANGGVKTVTVTGSNGVPSDATAVVVNITSAVPASSDYVQAYPVGRDVDVNGVPNAPLPTTSNLNVAKGENRANLSTVPIGKNGQISFKNYGGATRLVADVAGYYAPESTSGFHPVAPVRVMDTRNGTGVRKGKLGTGGVVTLTLTGAHSVPADATAVTLTLTAIKPTTPTYVQTYPAGTSPTTSSLNVSRGATTANQVVVKVGTNGQVSFRNNTGSTDLIADLAGWYGTESGGQQFRPTLPERVEDTRPNKLLGGRSIDEFVSDDAAVDFFRGIPVSATAGVVNLTATAATLATYLQVYPPSGSTVPVVSNLNLARGQTAASSATVQLASHRVRIRNAAGGVGVLLDLQGWFGPAS